MALKTFIFFDTETTGNGPQDRLCQLSYKTKDDTYESMYDELFLPPLKISIDAMVVHHITQDMVEGKPAFIDSSDYESLKDLFESEHSILVAHNADFDIQMLRREGIHPKNVIDTLRVARHLDPEYKIPRYGLQYLRYLLNLDADFDTNESDEPVIKPHDAKSDVIILELLFNRLEKKAVEMFGLSEAEPDAVADKLIELANTPVLVNLFAFGKYKGEKIANVAKNDPGYLQWLLGEKKQANEPGDEDIIYTLEYYLKS